MMICAEANAHRAEHVRAKSACACSGFSWSGVKHFELQLSTFPPSDFTHGQFQFGQTVGYYNALPLILPALKQRRYVVKTNVNED